MTEHEASRTLVKSPPELWAELSEVSSLSRHLDGSFGEIKITRLEPETAVAWEGECASGTVRIEPSGWGTRVTLTALMEALEAPPAAVADEEPEPVAVAEPEPVAAVEEPEPVAEEEPVAVVEDPPPVAVQPARGGLLMRMRARFRPPPPPVPVQTAAPAATEPEPEPVSEPVEVAPEPVAVEPEPAAVEPEPTPEPDAPEASEPGVDAPKVLAAALESLGQAHHRPFSRS
jgi:hypothetical protein